MAAGPPLVHFLAKVRVENKKERWNITNILVNWDVAPAPSPTQVPASEVFKRTDKKKVPKTKKNQTVDDPFVLDKVKFKHSKQKFEYLYLKRNNYVIAMRTKPGIKAKTLQSTLETIDNLHLPKFVQIDNKPDYQWFDHWAELLEAFMPEHMKQVSRKRKKFKTGKVEFGKKDDPPLNAAVMDKPLRNDDVTDDNDANQGDNDGKDDSSSDDAKNDVRICDDIVFDPIAPSTDDSAALQRSRPSAGRAYSNLPPPPTNERRSQPSMNDRHSQQSSARISALQQSPMTDYSQQSPEMNARQHYSQQSYVVDYDDNGGDNADNDVKHDFGDDSDESSDSSSLNEIRIDGNTVAQKSGAAQHSTQLSAVQTWDQSSMNESTQPSQFGDDSSDDSSSDSGGNGEIRIRGVTENSEVMNAMYSHQLSSLDANPAQQRSQPPPPYRADPKASVAMDGALLDNSIAAAHSVPQYSNVESGVMIANIPKQRK